MTTNHDGDNIEFKEVLPLLPIRELVVYPFMILPLFVGREASILAVEESLENYGRLIFLSGQKDISAETPGPEEIYNVGTIAMIMRMRKLPDGRIKILVQGLGKARIQDFKKIAPFYQVQLEKIESVQPTTDMIAQEAMIRTSKEILEKIIAKGKYFSPDILMVLEDIQDPGRIADLISSNLNLKVSEAQTILETENPVERLQYVNDILNRELEVINLQKKIKSAAKEEISKNQKEFFLREQIKAIKSELGDGVPEKNDEFHEIKQKMMEAEMPEDVAKEFLKQINRLEKMHPESSESSILRSYLECLVDLPWNRQSKEEIDLEKAKEILDDDHYDLDKIKERILEYLAVKVLKGESLKGPILCFTGPPGVGKTSLGKSIAKATGREFVRISLGGVKDEAEIRGHRRTYVGSMPGRFVQALQQAGTKNPIIMLDEVDKLGSDFRGDPSSALLEVLDPEQNHSFKDNYLNVPFDLSKVMFIATANNLETIPAPLRDRMEILTLSGYTQEEKLEICKRFLIPKQMDENGITPQHIEFTDDSIVSVIKHFTSEAGLRNLERQVGSLCRKIARKIASGHLNKTHILNKTVEEMLGPPIYHRDGQIKYNGPGIVTGLAWTSAGGEILFIESRKMKGKGLTLTGRLGEVMQESAKTAVGFIRSHAEDLGIDSEVFEKNEFHLHIPAGAVPKDGPSAGITLATAMISLIKDLEVPSNIAMTGEISLSGRILPIGGLKEKSLAAMREGIDTIIIPDENQKDLIEIPPQYKEKLNFIPVKNIQEAILVIFKKNLKGKVEEQGPETKPNKDHMAA